MSPCNNREGCAFAKVVGLLFMDEWNLYLQSCRLKGVGGTLRQREVRKIPRVVQTFFEHYHEAFFKLLAYSA